MKLLALCWTLLVSGVGALAAFDLGGTEENTATATISSASGTSPSYTFNPVVHLWANWNLGPNANFLLKANAADQFTQTLGQGYPLKNTVTADLESLVFNNEFLWVGRTDFRDFGSTVLNTKLDGMQLLLTSPNLDFKASLGTSAFLFKSGSTIVISEDDGKDRQVDENWLVPSTLMASPRIVADLEATAHGWIPDQNFHLALVGQYDLRPGEPRDGDLANIIVANRKGASVSTAYLGTGWDGRVLGPLYAGAWAYAVGGTSLTAVGAPVSVASGTKGVAASQYKTWKASTIVGGMGNLDLTLLLPSWSYLLVNAGVQVGSWDADGDTPDQNAGEDPHSMTPSLYTGWVGISRTGGSLIFNPQLSNMGVTQLVVSVKPFETLQLASSSFVFVRPIVAPISETGLDPASQDRYLGAESDLTVLWRPVSDVGGSLGIGWFFPNPQALTRGLETKVQTVFNVSF